jgi:hypothetical protein
MPVHLVEIDTTLHTQEMASAKFMWNDKKNDEMNRNSIETVSDFRKMCQGEKNDLYIDMNCELKFFFLSGVFDRYKNMV